MCWGVQIVLERDQVGCYFASFGGGFGVTVGSPSP